jgi:hypothetical protein
VGLYSPWYRFQSWGVRYLRLRDLLQVLLAAPVIYLLVRLYPYEPLATSIALVAYLILAGVALIDILKGRKARDYAQAAVLREFFAQLHGELFPDEERVRITLFCRAPDNEDFIVAWYRYTADAKDLIAEARKSQARFRRGEGFTGYAWENAGEDLVIATFPAFGSRSEFEEYYVKTLKISPEAVKGISDYMVEVRTVLSHGFTDSEGDFLGVLSVDLASVIEIDEVEGDDSQRIGAIRLNAGTMIQLLNSIENVLEAFARVKRGQDEHSTSL